MKLSMLTRCHDFAGLLRLNLIILSVCILTMHTFAQNHTIDEEYIKEWLVLGPFRERDLDKDFLADVGGESDINPKEGDTITTPDGETLTWKSMCQNTIALTFSTR